MHADLTDASVHVPLEALTPFDLRRQSRAESGDPESAMSGAAVHMPTYDEIAERALELFGRPPDAVARALAEWVDAEGQRRRLNR